LNDQKARWVGVEERRRYGEKVKKRGYYFNKKVL